MLHDRNYSPQVFLFAPCIKNKQHFMVLSNWLWSLITEYVSGPECKHWFLLLLRMPSSVVHFLYLQGRVVENLTSKSTQLSLM